MATKSSETDELLGLERRYWDALKNRDTATAVELSEDPCVIAGAQGVGAFTPKQLGAMMNDSRYELRNYRIMEKDAAVQLIGDDVAVLAYRVHEDLIVEGKPVQLDAADSSTWVKRDGKWRCALHNETILGDPFGRDRNLKPQPQE